MLSIRRIKPYTFVFLCFVALVVCRVLGVFSNQPVRETLKDREVLVTYVVDGDTIEATDGERIRLLGIDAPEVAHHEVAGEPFGEESTLWLRHRIDGKTVTLRFGPELTDRYGRTLAWIYAGPDAVLINEEALRTGNAVLLDRFGLPIELESRLRAAAAEAKSNKLGLWK